MILEAVFQEEEEMKADFGVVHQVNKVDASFVANALKGTAIGTAVAMKDVSPLPHNIGVKLSSDAVTSFSSVTLKKYGKNLIDLSQIANETDTKYTSFVDNGDGTYTLTKTGSRWQTETVPVYIPANTPFTISAKVISQSKPFSIGIVRTDDWWGRTLNKTLTEPYDLVGIFLYFTQGEADGTYSTFTDFQIEIGTATEYEPYKEPTTHKPKADGTVDGVTSLYPTTTLLTDTEGVTITAEYNKDLNKAFAEIYQKLSALGVAVVNN